MLDRIAEWIEDNFVKAFVVYSLAMVLLGAFLGYYGLGS